MNKSLTSKENTNSQDKKMKQMTLFDCKVKADSSFSRKELSKSQEEILIDDDDDNENKDPKMKKEGASLNKTKNEKGQSKLNFKKADTNENDRSTVKKEYKIGGKLIYKDTQIDNSLFGDIIAIIECFNNYATIFDKTQSNEKNYELISNEMIVKEIHYDELVDTLLTEKLDFKLDSKGQTTNYCLKIIETLLKLILHNEKNNLKKFIFFNLNFKRFISSYKIESNKEYTKFKSLIEKDGQIAFKFDPLNVQDLCRIVLQIESLANLLDDDTNQAENRDTKINAFLHDSNNNQHYQKLIQYLFEVEFKDFSVEKIVELIKTLCDRLISSDFFNDMFDTYRNNIKNDKIKKLEEKRNDLKIMIKEYEDSKKASNKDAEKNNLAIKNDKQHQAKKDELVEVLNKIDSIKLSIADSESIKPVGQDVSNNKYWIFNCQSNKLIREEIKTNTKGDQITSTWYEYTLEHEADDMNELINFLRHNDKNMTNIKLINILKKAIDNKKPPKKKKEVKKREVAIPEEGVRRSSRLTRAKINDDNKSESSKSQSNDDSDENDIEMIEGQKEEPINFMLRELHIYHARLANEEILKDKIENKNWKEKYTQTLKIEDFKEKFKQIKKLFENIYDSVDDKYIFKGYSSGSQANDSKMEIFKKCIKTSKTISNFSLLLRTLELSTKWWANQIKATTISLTCRECKEQFECDKSDLATNTDKICDECIEEKKELEKQGDVDVNGYSLRRNKERMKQQKKALEVEEDAKQTRVSRRLRNRVDSTTDTESVKSASSSASSNAIRRSTRARHKKIDSTTESESIKSTSPSRGKSKYGLRASNRLKRIDSTENEAQTITEEDIEGSEENESESTIGSDIETEVKSSGYKKRLRAGAVRTYFESEDSNGLK